MLILKHLKALQHVSIFIQNIFRELVGSLLKSLNLKITEFNFFLKGQLRREEFEKQHQVTLLLE